MRDDPSIEIGTVPSTSITQTELANSKQIEPPIIQRQDGVNRIIYLTSTSMD